jgi:hypothetical protein
VTATARSGGVTRSASVDVVVEDLGNAIDVAREPRPQRAMGVV